MMSRSLTLSALAIAAAPVSAAAASPLASPAPGVPAADYPARPGILYVNFEETVLEPPPCADGTTEANSAKNCSSTVAAETTVPAYGDATSQMALLDGLNTALAAYNVRITTERPASYVPYSMLMWTDIQDMDMMSTNDNCVFAPRSCDGKPRNETGIVVDSTVMCMSGSADPLMAGLIAFGRMAGLDRVMELTDVMGGPPDYTMPVVAFEDACNTITSMQPCTSYIHETYCPMMPGMQNSHQELLGVFGPRPMTEDTTAPEITLSPADGSTFMSGDPISITAMVLDDSGYTAGRWDWLEAPSGANAGAECMATNRAERWDDPTKPCPLQFQSKNDQGEQADAMTAAEYPFYNFGAGTPAGTFKFRFTASDMAGNESTQEITFTVEGAAGTSGGSGTGTATTAGTSTSTTSGGSSGGTDSGTGSGTGGEDGGGGCGCSTEPTAPSTLALALVGLLGLRRRRR